MVGTFLANPGHPRTSLYPRAPRGPQVPGRLRVPGRLERDSPAGESCWKMLFTGSPSLRRDQHSTTLLVWLDAHSSTWGGGRLGEGPGPAPRPLRASGCSTGLT